MISRFSASDSGDKAISLLPLQSSVTVWKLGEVIASVAPSNLENGWEHPRAMQWQCLAIIDSTPLHQPQGHFIPPCYLEGFNQQPIVDAISPIHTGNV